MSENLSERVYVPSFFDMLILFSDTSIKLHKWKDVRPVSGKSSHA